MSMRDSVLHREENVVPRCFHGGSDIELLGMVRAEEGEALRGSACGSLLAHLEQTGLLDQHL